MKLNRVHIPALFGCLILLQSVAAAEEGAPIVSLSTGVDFATGTYGGDVDIEDTYIPLAATVDVGRLAFRLTVPYLSVTAPEGTVFDPDGIPLPGSGDLVTEAGLGDIIGSVTLYDIINNRKLGFAMDLTGKVKFATANDDKGLGTGEADYSVQADFYKFMGDFTLLGSVGYKYRGDPADIDLDNVLMASAGGVYKFSPDFRGGLFFDYRESAISGSDSIQELTVFVSRRLTDDWKLQFFVMTGFTDSSLDWGGGFQVKRVM